MLAQLLYEKENASENSRPQFPDVAADDPSANAIAWASKEGLMNGYSDGSFRPDREIIRQELAAVLYRYAQRKGAAVETGDVQLSDSDTISRWAEPAVRWSVEAGLLNADGGAFHPFGTVTAGEAGPMLLSIDH